MYFNAYHYRWTIARMAPISELALAASRLAHVGAQIAARIRRHRWHDVASLRAIRAFVTSMGAACSLSSDSELEAYANDFDLVVDDCEVVGPPPSSARKLVEAIDDNAARDLPAAPLTLDDVETLLLKGALEYSLARPALLARPGRYR